MDVSQADWIKYKDELAAISEKAAQNLETWLTWKGGYQNVSKKDLIDMAYALATRYGEATASLAAEMYDETAALSGVSVASAEVADTASYGEIAKAINGVTKTVTTDSNLGNVVARYVKRAGADTTLKNAERDGAQFAWIPAGDTCPFCLTLASNGWQYQSKNAIKNGHASHIHANCDCTYAVRFDNKTNVKGYNPEKYREMYYNAEGKTPQERINSMRRIHYQENRDKILAQKKANYEAKKDMYNKKSDPVFSIFGSIEKSHPEEMERIIQSAKEKGVEVIDGNGERMGYAPGLKKGLPGQLIISKKDSIGAWKHEEQHMNDDYADNFPGFSGLFDIERRSQMEYNAYKKEIELAEQAGRKDIVDQLKEACKKEIEQIGGVWDEEKLK